MKRFWLAFIGMVTLVFLLLISPMTVLAGDRDIPYSYALRDRVKVYAKKDENSKIIATLAYMEPVEFLNDGIPNSGINKELWDVINQEKAWVKVKLLEGKSETGYVKMVDISIAGDIAIYYPVTVYLDETFEKEVGVVGPGEAVVISNKVMNEETGEAWYIATKDINGCIKPLERYKEYDELREIRGYASDKPKYIINKETKIKFEDNETAPYVAVLPEGTKVVVVTGRKEVFKICFDYGEIPMFGYVIAADLDRIK